MTKGALKVSLASPENSWTIPMCQNFLAKGEGINTNGEKHISADLHMREHRMCTL